MEPTEDANKSPEDKCLTNKQKIIATFGILTFVGIIAAIGFGLLYFDTRDAYNVAKRDNVLLHGKIETKDTQLSTLKQRFAEIEAKNYSEEMAKLQAQLKHLEELDRKCIAQYIKSRYSKTPTLLASAISNTIVDMCEKHKMPVALIVGLMEAESHFNPYAKSSAGALGLMQVIFKVWSKELDIANESDLHEIDKGIEYGVLVLKHYIAKNEGNLKKALWAYNGRDADHDKYANIVFTHVGRYILHKCRTSFKMEDFIDEDADTTPKQ